MRTAIVILSLLFSIGCRTEKHTGPVTVQSRANGDPIYQLLRPNNELFVMEMTTQPSPLFVNRGDSFTDIVYYDAGFKRAFVKAEGYKPAPPEPVTVQHQCWTTTQPGVQLCKLKGGASLEKKGNDPWRGVLASPAF